MIYYIHIENSSYTSYQDARSNSNLAWLESRMNDTFSKIFNKASYMKFLMSETQHKQPGSILKAYNCKDWYLLINYLINRSFINKIILKVLIFFIGIKIYTLKDPLLYFRVYYGYLEHSLMFEIKYRWIILINSYLTLLK